MFFIAGVSGKTGRVVAESLLAAGKSVRVLVRKPEQGEAWVARGAEVAVGSLDDVAVLTNALTGIDGAYLLLPPNMGAADFLAEKLDQAKVIAQALAVAKPPHVVLLSSVAAHLRAGTGPILAVATAERLWREIVPNLTVLRPGYFAENWGTALGGVPHGVFPVFNAPDLAFGMIATDDIGKRAAALLIEGGQGFRVVELAGPQFTPAEVAEKLSAIVGKPLVVQQIPVEAMAATLQGWGVGASIAALYQEMTAAMNAGAVAFEFPERVEQAATPVDIVLRKLVGG